MKIKKILFIMISVCAIFTLVGCKKGRINSALAEDIHQLPINKNLTLNEFYNLKAKKVSQAKVSFKTLETDESFTSFGYNYLVGKTKIINYQTGDEINVQFDKTEDSFKSYQNIFLIIRKNKNYEFYSNSGENLLTLVQEKDGEQYNVTVKDIKFVVGEQIIWITGIKYENLNTHNRTNYFFYNGKLLNQEELTKLTEKRLTPKNFLLHDNKLIIYDKENNLYDYKLLDSTPTKLYGLKNNNILLVYITPIIINPNVDKDIKYDFIVDNEHYLLSYKLYNYQQKTITPLQLKNICITKMINPTNDTSVQISENVFSYELIDPATKRIFDGDKRNIAFVDSGIKNFAIPNITNYTNITYLSKLNDNRFIVETNYKKYNITDKNGVVITSFEDFTVEKILEDRYFLIRSDRESSQYTFNIYDALEDKIVAKDLNRTHFQAQANKLSGILFYDEYHKPLLFKNGKLHELAGDKFEKINGIDFIFATTDSEKKITYFYELDGNLVAKHDATKNYHIPYYNKPINYDGYNLNKEIATINYTDAESGKKTVAVVVRDYTNN